MNNFLRLMLTLCVLAIASGEVIGSTSSVFAAKEEVPRLQWKGKKIEIALSRSLLLNSPNIKVGSDVAGAIRRSIAAWQNVAAVEIRIQETSRQDVSPSGLVGDGVSLITIAASPENILFFGKDPYAASAKTRIFYNRRGFITEADIVLNPFQLFSTDGSYGTFDLESTLRHEIGHLLGLRHSAVVGATMYDSATKNGVFGTGFSDLGLTEDDIAAVRGIYGSAEPEQDCCGSIVGKISPTVRGGREYTVLVQESATGRLVANSVTDRSRNFRIEGLKQGKYSVFAVETGKSQRYSAQFVDDVKVENESVSTVTVRYIRQPINYSLELLGTNGILSDSPIFLQRGSTQRIFAGGMKLSTDRVRFECDSPYLSIEPDSVENIQFDSDLTGVSFSITVDPDTPPGQYNILAKSADGSYDVRIGAISVR